MIIEHIKQTESTNEYVKKFIKKRENALVRADFQTAGKGTKGRSFISEEGGLYVSKLTFYQNLLAQNAWSIMIDSAMAVVKTLLAYGIDAKIKWPNDIVVNGKKICGILITNTFKGEFVDYSIVGIGINVNNQLHESISDIATSVKQVIGREIDLDNFFLTFMMNYSSCEKWEDYKKYNLVIGKKIKIIRGEEIFEEVAKDILPNGALLLESGEILYAGEINLKITV